MLPCPALLCVPQVAFPSLTLAFAHTLACALTLALTLALALRLLTPLPPPPFPSPVTLPIIFALLLHNVFSFSFAADMVLSPTILSRQPFIPLPPALPVPALTHLSSCNASLSTCLDYPLVALRPATMSCIPGHWPVSQEARGAVIRA